MNFLSDTLVIRYDGATGSLLISHPDTASFPHPFVNIREETYSAMHFNELSEFLGARLLLLIPGMRVKFKAEIEAFANSEFGNGLTRGSDNGPS